MDLTSVKCMIGNDASRAMSFILDEGKVIALYLPNKDSAGGRFYRIGTDITETIQWLSDYTLSYPMHASEIIDMLHERFHAEGLPMEPTTALRESLYTIVNPISSHRPPQPIRVSRRIHGR